MTYIPNIFSGLNIVAQNAIVTINTDRQMINYGGLRIEGVLVINGDLILK